MGYGLAGNQGGIDSYTTMALVRPNGVTPVGNSPLVTYESLKNVNPDLKWEVKSTFNAGVDMGFYGNRLLLSVNYYLSKTRDMLYMYDVSVPPLPKTNLYANLGSKRNRQDRTVRDCLADRIISCFRSYDCRLAFSICRIVKDWFRTGTEDIPIRLLI